MRLRVGVWGLALTVAACALAPLGASAQQAKPASAQQSKPAEAEPREAKQKPPAGGPPKPFVLPKRETWALPNGMKVTFVPYGTIPKVSVTAVVRTGAIDEPADKVWLSNLTGLMIREGTTTRTGAQVAEQAARMGGSVNTGFGADTMTVGGDVLSEFGPQFVELVADVAQRPALPESELTRVRTDLERQLSLARSQPGPLANEQFRHALYPDHPYGRVFPTEESLGKLSAADVRKFYDSNFGAARTHLYVVGRFDGAAMKKAVEAAFSGWKKGTPPTTMVPKPVAERRLLVVDRPGAPQSTLYIGLPAVDPTHKDYVALQVANALLGGSFSSRITSNIREAKGYTYSPGSQVSTRYRDAFWLQTADVTTSVTGPSLKEIFYEIDRLRSEPPSDEELQGIKNYMAGIFVLQNSSRQGVIGQLSFVDLHGLPETYLTRYVDHVLAVTPKDVQRVTQQYLTPDKMTIVVVGDKSQISEQIAAYGTANGQRN